MDPVRVVVVGAGHLGTYHLQKVAADERATLVGVVDTDSGARERAAAEYGVPGVASIAEIDAADAAIVAAPTIAHREVAEAASRYLAPGHHVVALLSPAAEN